MHCKSLWIKASAKCINVNVNHWIITIYQQIIILPYHKIIKIYHKILTLPNHYITDSSKFITKSSQYCISLNHHNISPNHKKGHVWQSLVTHTQNLCSAFNPSKSTHTVNTHPEQWAANGEQMGVRCLAQRVSSQSWYCRWRERSLFTPSTDNSCRTRDSNPQPRVTSLTLYPLGHNCPYITLSSYHRFIYIYIYIYAFSRRFYPKRLTIAFRLYIKIYHKIIKIYH